MSKILINKFEENEINNIYIDNTNKGVYTNFFKYILNSSNKFLKGLYQNSNVSAISLFDYFSYLIIKNRKAEIINENEVEKFKELVYKLFDNKSFIVGLNKKQIKELIRYSNNLKLPNKMMDKIYELVLEYFKINDDISLLLNFSKELNKKELKYLNKEINCYLKKYNLSKFENVNPLYELKNVFDNELDQNYDNLVLQVKNIYNKENKPKQKILK